MLHKTMLCGRVYVLDMLSLQLHSSQVVFPVLILSHQHGHLLQPYSKPAYHRQATARQEEEERQQQLLAEARAAQELKKRRELERQARVKEEEQRQQQLLEEAKARRDYHRQQQLQEQAAALQEQQLQQQQQADLRRKQQHDQAVRQQEEAAASAAAAHAQAEQAALAAEAETWSQESEECQSEVVGDRQAEQDGASQQPLPDGSKERNWKSADHWLPQRGAPKVTVIGEQPRGWPNGAAFPALPPPNIFRGQG